MTLDVTVPAGLEGFVAGIAGALDFGSTRVKAVYAGLTPDQLTYVPPGLGNSIATLVVHVAATEVSFAHRLRGETVPDELKVEYLIGQGQNNMLPVASGETPETLTAKLEKARSIVLGALAGVTAADMDKTHEISGGRVITGRWMLSLLPNHQSQHLGQMQLIKRLLPK